MYRTISTLFCLGILSACASTNTNPSSSEKTNNSSIDLQVESSTLTSENKLTLAKQLYESAQPEKALKLYQEAANEGLPRAQSEDRKSVV